PSALDLAFAVADALTARGVPHAIGGALALGVWSNPRGTVDVDINVFVGDDGLAPVFDALDAIGASFDRVHAAREAAARGMFVAHAAGMRIDVFTPSIELSHEAGRTAQRVAVGDREYAFLSAEAIALFKLLFFRGKDRVDLERLVAAYPLLDRAYV